MTASALRQDFQLRNSTTYLDNLIAGGTLESGASTAEDDFNALRSQLNRVLDATGAGAWTDDIATVNAAQRGLLQLGTDLDDLEEKRRLCRTIVLTNITVGGADDFVVLNVAGSEAPTLTAAVGALTLGAVVAQSAASGGAFDSSELTELSGVDALHPKNLALVRSATTAQRIQSSGRDVFGLLQYESTGADGGAFDDVSASARVKISFVRPNATFTDLEACPAADIQGQSIQYIYTCRTTLDAAIEDSYLGQDVFLDQSASVDVTLQAAFDNQGATPVEVTGNSDLDLGASVQLAIRDAANADLLNISEGSAGGTTTITIGADADVYQNSAPDVDFTAGVTVNGGGTRPIDVGVADGIIASTAGDLELQAAAELLLDDGNRSGSTWAGNGVKLSDSQAEWDALEVAFGAELSLAAMLTDAKTSIGAFRKVQAVLTAVVAADTDLSGPANDNNIDVNFGDLSGGVFVDDFDFYINGQLVRSGANLGAAEEVYPGTSLANGQVRFTYQLRSTGKPDVVTMFARA